MGRFRLCILSFVLSLLLRSVVSLDDDNSLAKAYFDDAKSTLDAISNNTPELFVKDEEQIVVQIPMDYSEELERQQYEQDLKNLSPEKLRVKELLEKSSSLGNVDATFLLAEMNLYGNYSFPRNGSLALKYYKEVIELSPNSTAYFNLGFIYSTGLFGEVEQNQARAILYYNYAFDQGDLRAAMVLGFRYLYGISVPHDCERSLYYYKIVAEKVLDFFNSSIPGGPNIDSYSLRVADLQGGAYGKGASESHNTLFRTSSRFKDYEAPTPDEELLKTAYLTAILDYEGSYLNPRQYDKAFQLATFLIRTEFDNLKALSSTKKLLASKTLFLVGHMYLRGEGVTRDFEKAHEYLTKATELNSNSEAHADLGLLYQSGKEGYNNLTKAEEHFQKSALLENVKGMYYYGRILKARGDPKGDELIKSAAYSGSTEAVYYFASKIEKDAGDSCEGAVTSFKFFAERVEPVVSSLEWTFKQLLSGDYKNALLGYAIAAEQGYETAQASAAFLLYQQPSIIEDPPVIPQKRKELALAYLTRSSRQYNLDSNVMMGDIYFSNKDYESAAACYDAASARESRHASFNLGWMYENGYGVEQDFHLAKRYYDLALINSSKSYIPVQLALLKLRFRSFINHITGGEIKGINSEKKEERTWADWKALYKKIRNTNYNFFEEEVDSSNNFERLTETSNMPTQETISEIDNDTQVALEMSDYFVLGVFFIIFVTLCYLSLNQRRRANNGQGPDNDGRPNFEFNFRIIAI